ncbi:four helix bundle protein [Prolixibacter sp. NT017]|uniref:four helix bundle protein n=1 Tax=Prolixibacter sp. NT017 TaxID=2652390 RepID=UPI0012824B89|nr:four helix bundle protein [Prolixibacter sp. NT017]GET24885.1 four helix bundle protein [Prolixibacter sp. NT017]
MKENQVVDKSFAFALKIVELSRYLMKEKNEYILSKQVLRSGTSIGANIEEAQGGFSKKDFSAKMGIAYKEARETKYWLRLLHQSGYIDEAKLNSLLPGCEELLKMLYYIVKNSKAK